MSTFLGLGMYFLLLVYKISTGFNHFSLLIYCSIAKMDLNYVLTLSDKVKLVTEPIEDKDILQNFKAKYGGVEVYKRAKTVWVGETPKVTALISF